eukprot:CAMPEP_0170577648 /NCGR_PEP_ID=MMETSP0224-20130122/5042_1 /TAXON_ID=285029 /ORGANISM="Togula jolla, Strain CCCM 725" /LENGTH=625 /DNA_ID=CAMNT_0010900579 /DNA_START=124 /DNA_END=2001 /DNA_ORIENTATION=-
MPSSQIILLCLLSLTNAFYLPGVAPTQYEEGARVELKVNKLTSVKTQLPYSYYTLPVCTGPNSEISSKSLGEILTGDEIKSSAYKIRMKEDVTCKRLCTVPLKEKEKETLRRMVDEDYWVNWIVDNLPASTNFTRVIDGKDTPVTMVGFPVGSYHKDGTYSLNNHVTLHLEYHQNPNDKEGTSRIVGFRAQPYSISQSFRDDILEENGDKVICSGAGALPVFDFFQHNKVTYTYDVVWTESQVQWASRWDSYLQASPGSNQIHWFSILNSFVIVLILSVMVGMILLRTLLRDIAKYNELATKEEAAEETGWKLLHADVFREPPYSKLLVVSVGSGLQVLGMSTVVLIFALLGFLSPANRGGLLQSMMLLFTFMGLLSGYAAARMYRIFEKEDIRKVMLLTAILYPGVVFAIFFILNLFIWAKGSTGAVPFLTLFELLTLWFGISVPLVFLGSHYGFRRAPIELPTRTNKIPRGLPEQHWLSHPVPVCLAGGMLPFGSVFTEVFFILSSIWQHQFYYVFGFLALVMVILVITCAEVSIALIYFQLTAEDYRWWWRSFFSSGSSGLMLFAYSIFYHSTLQIEEGVSSILYFGYMIIMSLMLALLTGSIGTVSSFIFVKGIYGSVKID